MSAVTMTPALALSVAHDKVYGGLPYKPGVAQTEDSQEAVRLAYLANMGLADADAETAWWAALFERDEGRYREELAAYGRANARGYLSFGGPVATAVA